jgi:hypothetical protein
MTTTSDIELLRRFEPVIRYTKGESFFPMDVGRYVRESSLWVYRPNQPTHRIWGDGDLTLSRLAETQSHGPNSLYYLKFIDPISLTDMLAYQIEQVREGITGQAEDVFRAGRGRLARVGYISRFVDGLFSLSLLARGRVPGDTAVAAARAYKQMMLQHEEYKYYGRVVRKNGWIALQYWFFYAYNNWRSGFYGANDHESDWEMIYIYLYEDDYGELHPEWLAYASHDFSGDIDIEFGLAQRGDHEIALRFAVGKGLAGQLHLIADAAHLQGDIIRVLHPHAQSQLLLQQVATQQADVDHLEARGLKLHGRTAGEQRQHCACQHRPRPHGQFPRLCRWIISP